LLWSENTGFFEKLARLAQADSQSAQTWILR
jgi:hypothetical protein